MWAVAGLRAEQLALVKKSVVPALLFIAVAPVAAGYSKLGSSKPGECNPKTYSCPSHMVCVPSDHGTRHCICDRFLGFRGQECREHTRASWLLLVITIIITLWAFWALLSNITLAIELKDAGRLKANSIGRTLFFNSLSTLPVAALATGIGLTVFTDVDPHMEFYQNGRSTCIVGIFFCYILATLSVSVVWIIDVQKMASVGLGTEITRVKKRQERVYLTAAFVIALSSAALIYSVIGSSPFVGLACIGIFYNIFVGVSYFYAGRRVIRVLRKAEVSSSIRQVDIAQIAQNIRNTSQTMTRLTLGMSVGFIGGGLTTPTSSPSIQGQNSLPRVLQGQLFYFMTQACVLGVNQLIVEYMRYGSKKRHLKPQSATGSAVGWLLCLPSARQPYVLRTVVFPDPPKTGEDGDGKMNNLKEATVDGEEIAYRRGILSRPRGELSCGLELFDAYTIEAHMYYNLYGTDSQNQCIVKVAVEQSESGDGIVQPQLSSVPSAGARQYLPIMLATLHTEGSDDDADLLSVETLELRPRVRGTIVMNIGSGVVVNLEAENMAKEELEVPSKGSHAFVRCYGENHLRCTWHTFEFGFAGGHELLANRSTVLMEGEVEVDESGFVTRWLHKSGVNTAPLLGLNKPPRWVVGLLGFPFSATWRTVTVSEVNALAEHLKASLVSQSHLIRLDCSTQPSIPDAPTTSRFASSCCAAISTFKVLSSNLIVPPANSRLTSRGIQSGVPNSSHGSFASDISSISAGSVYTNDSRASPVGIWGRGGIQACVVPGAVTHAEETWIMKDDMWKASLLQSAFVSVRDSLASFRLAKRSENRPVRLIFEPEGLSDRDSLSGSGRGVRIRFSDEKEFEHPKCVSDGISDIRSLEASSIESDLIIRAVLPPLRNSAIKKKKKGPPPFIIIQLTNNKQRSLRPQSLTGVWGIEESEHEDVLDEDDNDITGAMGTSRNTGSRMK